MHLPVPVLTVIHHAILHYNIMEDASAIPHLKETESTWHKIKFTHLPFTSIITTTSQGVCIMK